MTSSEIRKKARETLENNFLISILAGAIASSLGGLLTGASVTFSFNFQSGFQFNIGSEPFSASAFSAVFIVVFILLFCFIIVYSLIYSIVSGVIQLGYAQLLLNQQDGRNYSPKDMFSQFYRAKEGFWQIFLRGIFTFLWSLLLIVPGIIKSYSYAMTPFIMAEHPELSAKEAIRASQALMKGHKAALFRLDLSFLGWELLTALTFGRGFYVINPYKNTAYAIFYRSISRPVSPAEVIE